MRADAAEHVRAGRGLCGSGDDQALADADEVAFQAVGLLNGLDRGTILARQLAQGVAFAYGVCGFTGLREESGRHGDDT